MTFDNEDQKKLTIALAESSVLQVPVGKLAEVNAEVGALLSVLKQAEVTGANKPELVTE